MAKRRSLMQKEPIGFCISVVRKANHGGEQDLAELLAVWLGEDHETWPVLRLTMIVPWQERSGEWHKDIPTWLLLLGEKTAGVLEKRDPFRRREIGS